MARVTACLTLLAACVTRMRSGLVAKLPTRRSAAATPNRPTRRWLLPALWWALADASRGAGAPLVDPMRPPSTAALPTTREAAGAGAATPDHPSGGQSAGPQLQATRRNADGTWIALIDERWRRVGERHGELAVLAIRANDVVLGQGSQRITVALPGARSAAAAGTESSPPAAPAGWNRTQDPRP